MNESEESLLALKNICLQIRDIQLRSEERLKAQHGRFNVFTTLLAAHDEVRLHTLIHELLNPQGTHDCGELFLDLFFQTLEMHGPLDHDGVSSGEDWTLFCLEAGVVCDKNRSLFVSKVV